MSRASAAFCAAAAFVLVLIDSVPATGQARGPVFTEYTTPGTTSSPSALVSGPDGALWYGDYGKIGRMTAAGEFTEYPVSPGYITDMTVGPDGALWFAENGSICRITTAGNVTACHPLPSPTSFPILTSNAPPYGITPGADGALWFVQYGRTGRITTTGVMNEYVLPMPGNIPRKITAGPSGLIAFIENGRIGIFDLLGVVGGGMLVQAYSKQGTNQPSLSLRIGGTTPGNFLIAVVRMASTGVTLSDTSGNSFTEAVSQNQDQNGHRIHIFYASNIPGGPDTVTAAFDSSNNHSWLSVYEYAGIRNTNPLDRIARAQGFGATVDTGLTPETTNANELLFAVTGQEPATYDPIQPGSGFTLLQQDTGESRATTEAVVVNRTGTFSGTFSTTDAHIWSAALATFVATGPPIGPSITTQALSNAYQNVDYSASLAGAGGSGPYKWSVIAGSLPLGMSVNSNGQLSGRPSAPGTSSFTVQLADGNFQNTTQTLSLVVDVQAPAVQMSLTLPDGSVGFPYNVPLFAEGGSPPYTWSIVGNLPVGLTLHQETDLGGGAKLLAHIGGTPAVSAISNFTLQVTDSRSLTATKEMSISIYKMTEETEASVVYQGSWYPNSNSFNSQNGAVQALDAGSRATFTFSGTEVTWIGVRDVYSGIANVYLDGMLAATVDTYYSSDFRMAPLYTASSLPDTAHTLTIEATGMRSALSGGAWIWLDGFKTLGPTGSGSYLPSIKTSSLPIATQNTPYNAQLVAAGSTKPYRWAINGSLPAGLTLDINTGAISGTPTNAGWVAFTATVNSDTAGQSASKRLSITINPNSNPALSITTTLLPAGMQQSAFTATLEASGGRGPYTWSISSGSLPAGLTLNPGTGVISATPTAWGTFDIQVQATDSAGATASKIVTVWIRC